MAKKRTAKEWLTVVERWQRSGLSAKEFAAAEGLVASTLSWWKWHLRAKELAAKKEQMPTKPAPTKSARKKSAAKKTPTPKQRASKKRIRRARARDTAAIPLVELVAPVAAATSETPIELVVGDDVVVRLRRDFDAGTLRQLLAVFGGEDKARC